MTEAAPRVRHRMTDRRAAAAWWGVLALVVQILVPLGQAVPVVGADGLPRMLALCSATGPRAVPLPGPAGQPSPSEAQSPCIVCLAYGVGAATLLPASAVPPFPPAGAGQRLDAPAATLAHGLTPGLPRARGPPGTV